MDKLSESRPVQFARGALDGDVQTIKAQMAGGLDRIKGAVGETQAHPLVYKAIAMESPVHAVVAATVSAQADADYRDIKQRMDQYGGGLKGAAIAINEKYNPGVAVGIAGVQTVDSVRKGDWRATGENASRTGAAIDATIAVVEGVAGGVGKIRNIIEQQAGTNTGQRPMAGGPTVRIPDAQDATPVRTPDTVSRTPETHPLPPDLSENHAGVDTRTAGTGLIDRIKSRILGDGSLSVTVEGEVSPKIDRHDLEDGISATAGMDRAHLWPRTWGDEAAAGVMSASFTVNRSLQTRLANTVSNYAASAAERGNVVRVQATGVSVAGDRTTLDHVQYRVWESTPSGEFQQGWTVTIDRKGVLSEPGWLSRAP